MPKSFAEALSALTEKQGTGKAPGEIKALNLDSSCRAARVEASSGPALRPARTSEPRLATLPSPLARLFAAVCGFCCAAWLPANRYCVASRQTPRRGSLQAAAGRCFAFTRGRMLRMS